MERASFFRLLCLTLLYPALLFSSLFCSLLFSAPVLSPALPNPNSPASKRERIRSLEHRNARWIAAAASFK